jgi:hypothetical protein
VIKVRHVMHGQAGQVGGDFASKCAGTLTEPLECREQSGTSNLVNVTGGTDER